MQFRSLRNLILLMLLTLATLALAAPRTFTGTLTDTMCSQKHMMPGKSDADCVRECVKGGGAYALVSGAKTYTLKGDRKQFDSLAGQKVTVTGEAQGSTIAVSSIAAAK